MRALDGIRVFEIGIAIAAPGAGRALAFHGAEVIKVESQASPDVVRLLGSAWLRDDEEHAAAWGDSSPYVPEMNADKKSIALELKTPEGRDAAHRLVAECDVFLANFSAKALVSLGLDYETVSKLRPDIVYVQLPGFGSDPTMPYYPFVAWGPNQAPLVGMDELTGYPDQEPAGIATIAPPDYLSAQHAVTAVLAGLAHRDATGEGMHVDVSQFETTIGMLGPFVMHHALTGVSQSRIGNRSLWAAPEGVYPCRGHERWIALSVESDEQWTALVALSGGRLDDARWSTSEGRHEHHDDLDDALAQWTADHENGDLAARLQAAGIAAHLVATNEDVLQDEHIKQRGWYHITPSPRFTRELFHGHAIRMSATPGTFHRASPLFGEHTREVLAEVAGMDPADVDAMVTAGQAHDPPAPDMIIDRPYEQWLHVLFPGVTDTRDLT